MYKTLRNQLKWTMALLAVIGTGSAAVAGDLSRYRDFAFGADLPTIAQKTGSDVSRAKTIHTRPALIQELEWRPQPLGPSAKNEAASEVLFRFLDGKLCRIEVKYDRYETEGLTVGDIVDAVSAVYGPATRIAVAGPPAADSYLDREEVAAQWQGAQFRFDLVHSSSGYRLIGVERDADAAADSALREAKRLDDAEAPQREAAREAGERDLAATKLAKARAANKARFRP